MTPATSSFPSQMSDAQASQSAVIDHSTNEEYHSWSEVSCSQLKQLRESPLAFFYRHVEKSQAQKSSPALTYGSLLHEWAELGSDEFWPKVVIAPDRVCTATGSFGAKAKPWLDELEDGAIPISPSDYKQLRMQTHQIYANSAARNLLVNAVDREFNIRWTWNNHECRCRVDGATRQVFYDLKTTRDARILKDFGRSAIKFGYHMQAAMYGAAAIAAGWPEHRMEFIVTSTTWPHECEVVRLPNHVMEEGRVTCLRLLAELRHRKEWDAWHPNTYGKVHELNCPTARRKESL